MLTAIKESTAQAERSEPHCVINWDKLYSIPVWREPVGVTQPEPQPIFIAKIYPDGSRALMFLEPRYQLSNEYLARLN